MQVKVRMQRNDIVKPRHNVNALSPRSSDYGANTAALRTNAESTNWIKTLVNGRNSNLKGGRQPREAQWSGYLQAPSQTSWNLKLKEATDGLDEVRNNNWWTTLLRLLAVFALGSRTSTIIALMRWLAKVTLACWTLIAHQE